MSITSTKTAGEQAAAPTRHLRWRLLPVLTFLVYAAITLYSWSVICMARNRRIGKTLEQNEGHIRTAEILQSIATVLTIPITSAICSFAFVAFLQHGSLRTKLNFRQTMALADQGWLSPRVLRRVDALGSLPLYIAFVLTIVGSASQILQRSIYRREHIMVDSDYHRYSFTGVPNVPSMWPHPRGYGEDILRLRSLLETTAANQFEPYLWGWRYSSAEQKFVISPANRLDYLHDGYDGYFVPLPASFNAGAYEDPQYAPRINFTLEYTSIHKEEFPKECNKDLKNGFFVEYHYLESRKNVEEPLAIYLVACMPNYLRIPPWKAQYGRQDVEEALYLNISHSHGSSNTTGGLYKTTANSTLGYFELPSLANGNRPGPLKGPDWSMNEGDIVQTSLTKRQLNDTFTGNNTMERESAKGPLTSLAFALFGEGSYIQTHISNPSAFVVDASGSPACRALPPLGRLAPTLLNPARCLDYSDFANETAVISHVGQWVAEFTSEISRQEELRVGLFLANKNWFLHGSFGKWDTIFIDDGVPTFRTKISLAGVIISSVLLGAHLLGLLVLVLYANYLRTWTAWLGAEVVAKMGTTYADVLGAAEGKEQWRRAAKACPGFIGDEDPKSKVGRARFGALPGLVRDKGRKFTGL